MSKGVIRTKVILWSNMQVYIQVLWKFSPKNNIWRLRFCVTANSKNVPLKTWRSVTSPEAVSLMFPCLALGRFRLEEVWASGLFLGESYGGQNQSSKVFRTWKYEKKQQSFPEKGHPTLNFNDISCKHAVFFLASFPICHPTTPIDVLLSWQLPWTTHCASRQVVHNRCPW